VALLLIIGLLALVIPGLIVINLLGLVGPVIDIEDRPVFAALRRSAHLVRPRFWWVALLVILPLALASEIERFDPDPSSVRAVLEIIAVRGLAAGVAEAAIGLILVKLCYRLIELDRAAAAEQQPGQAAQQSREP
jgi:predicted secreted protein